MTYEECCKHAEKELLKIESTSFYLIGQNHLPRFRLTFYRKGFLIEEEVAQVVESFEYEDFHHNSNLNKFYRTAYFINESPYESLLKSTQKWMRFLRSSFNILRTVGFSKSYYTQLEFDILSFKDLKEINTNLI